MLSSLVGSGMDVHVTPWRPCLACDGAIAKEYTRGKETSRFLIECNVGGGDKSHCSLSHATPPHPKPSPPFQSNAGFTGET